jgi:hypothetical protein
MSVNTAKLGQQTKMTRLHVMVFVIRCSTVARNIRRRFVAIADCPRRSFNWMLRCGLRRCWRPERQVRLHKPLLAVPPIWTRY